MHKDLQFKDTIVSKFSDRFAFAKILKQVLSG